jgi:hypothetical protein
VRRGGPDQQVRGDQRLPVGLPRLAPAPRQPLTLRLARHQAGMRPVKKVSSHPPPMNAIQV